MSGSTPHKPSSRQVASPKISSSTPRSQVELKDTIENEIADQTFHFPSQSLSRMLSPKTPKPHVEGVGGLLRLDDYDCTVDGKPFLTALDDVVMRLKTFTPQAGTGESASYPGFAKFLTECVKMCHEALDKQNGFPPRQDRWYKDLEFTVGKSAVDGVEGAAFLKPDITGGKGISVLAEERLYWKPPAEKPTHRITLPVEVKKHWRAMISQAATYARCLFSASPMQRFVLTLAFNQESNMLRFLVFHRGGLTASNEYDITKSDGLKEIARLFLTLASWGTAEEAGVITCCSENVYSLPANEGGTEQMWAEAKGILSRFVCVRGRSTYVSRLHLPTNTTTVTPAPLGKKLPNPVAEWSGPLRRSARLIEKSKPSGPAPRAGSSREPGLQGVATSSREKGKGALPTAQGGTDGWFFPSRQSRGKLMIR
jgi:hypothetical protein